MRRRKPASVIALLVVLGVIWFVRNHVQVETPDEMPPRAPEAAPPKAPRATAGPQDTDVKPALRQAIARQQSGIWVEGEGAILHLLPEDRRPPRHQLCLVELEGGHTIKISHNVDLAPKVPWRKGDRLAFRGRFEWNAKGGVVHWTHKDPKGRKAGGWLEHDSKRYR